MSARAHVSLTCTITLCAIIFGQQIIYAQAVECRKDGLYTDYDRDCQEYVRCSGGSITGRYKCPIERMFSEAKGACVPRERLPCVRRECEATDTLAYATPGTACRHYYRCENGTAVEHPCPHGAWFDQERQACTRGAGTCFEPVCVGLPDGDYPDASHECRRVLKCRSGELRSVASCGSCNSACPPPRKAAVPLPAGDADFCSDEACSSLCLDVADGAYADRTSGCHEYFVCEAHRVIRRGVCEQGSLFSDGVCELATHVKCPPPALSPCFNREDGIYRDWRDCASWYECRRERVISRGSCAPELIFDGRDCVKSSEFLCDGPEPSVECEGLPTGMYQDFASNCTQYFQCKNALRTMLACPQGEVFDGVKCTSSTNYLCPSLDRESCYERPDGRYRAADTGCRGYYECVRGVKAIYACPVGRVFDGETCVQSRPGLCLREDYSCMGLTDGYHPEIESGCRRYFYCERGDRLTTLTCKGGKIFDGRTCMKSKNYECGTPPRHSHEHDKLCRHDGFYVQHGTQCKRYYFCVSGTKTYLTCPNDQMFNGQVCVSSSQYTCPG